MTSLILDIKFVGRFFSATPKMHLRKQFDSSVDPTCLIFFYFFLGGIQNNSRKNKNRVSNPSKLSVSWNRENRETVMLL